MLRCTWVLSVLKSDLKYRTVTFCGWGFHPILLSSFNTHAYSGSAWESHDPIYTTPWAYIYMVWAVTVSLAATQVIVFTLFSSRYLDVSVPLVPVLCLCVQHKTILKSPDHSLLTTPRSLSQLSHVIHRLLPPRHPPYTLSILITTLLNSQKNCTSITSEKVILKSNTINIIYFFSANYQCIG